MAAPPGPFGHVPGLPVPAPAPAVVGNYIAAAMLTTMNTIAQHLTAQAGAREENHLIGSLKIELIPHHLHEKIPKVCTWRLQLHVSFPPFWVVVASLKPAALTRADLWKDMEMPGEWILMFRNGIDMHYPTLDKAIKERVVARFLEVITTYVSYVPVSGPTRSSSSQPERYSRTHGSDGDRHAPNSGAGPERVPCRGD